MLLLPFLLWLLLLLFTIAFAASIFEQRFKINASCYCFWFAKMSINPANTETNRTVHVEIKKKKRNQSILLMHIFLLLMVFVFVPYNWWANIIMASVHFELNGILLLKYKPKISYMTLCHVMTLFPFHLIQPSIFCTSTAIKSKSIDLPFILLIFDQSQIRAWNFKLFGLHSCALYNETAWINHWLVILALQSQFHVTWSSFFSN